jgi:hypothetical protein
LIFIYESGVGLLEKGYRGLLMGEVTTVVPGVANTAASILRVICLSSFRTTTPAKAVINVELAVRATTCGTLPG